MARVFTITEGLENMGALKTGGQGSVYKGRRIGEIYTAIKILPTPIYSESDDDKNFISFRNEVEKLKKVNEEPNPNVVSILNSGITDSGNLPFIEMEYIDGPDLEELLKPPHDPIFAIKEVIRVAEQLSNALAHCHKVQVRHGDVKSNNVKFNIRTGNYILLDFGLSVMSDEQRRTSLRHAGAIEFMAPEQNEGLMLPQTDVYSFGVVMFELLTGQVPFPLKDNGETSRNAVMVAHMETSPPSIVALRRQKLPAHWPQEKKELEMRIPGWLLSMVYKCLEKDPKQRFEDGQQLRDYTQRNSIITASKAEWSTETLATLKEDNERLARENERLEKLVRHYEQTLANQQQQSIHTPAEPAYHDQFLKKKGWTKANTWLSIICAVVLGVIGYLAYNSMSKSSRKEAGTKTKTAPAKPSAAEQKLATQLKNGRMFMDKGEYPKALWIYKNLLPQEVPEAMYHYGRLALLGINKNIECFEAVNYITKASNKGYVPAKRTLGFLYAFGNNYDAMREYGYDNCDFNENMQRGSKLLMEAMLEGDTTAGRLLEELNQRRIVP
jgi:serine/threonine protein kinase